MNIERNFRVLSEEQLELIWQTGKEILYKVGFQAPHEKVKQKLAAFGAKVQGDVIKVPIEICDKAIACLKRPEQVPQDNKLTCYLSPNGSRYVVDIKSKTRREATIKDVEKTAILTNRFEYMNKIGRCFEPQDVPEHLKAVKALAALATYSNKGEISSAIVVKTDLEHECLERIIAIRNGVEYQPKKKPPCSGTVYMISPLCYQPEDLDRAYRVLEAGFNPSILSMPTQAQTAPATMFGTLCQRIAENLSAIVICQSIRSGSEVGLGWSGRVSDPRTGEFSNGPESTLMSCAAAQLSEKLGYRPGYCPGSNSFVTDMAHGVQWSMETLMPFLAGCKTCGIGEHGVGGGQSFERLFMVHEMIGQLNKIVCGIPSDEPEDIVNLLSEVNFKAEFLDKMHTAQHCRDIWVSPLVHSGNWEIWQGQGAKDAWDLAHEQVNEIFAEPFEKQITPEQQEQIEDVLKRADSEHCQ